MHRRIGYNEATPRRRNEGIHTVPRQPLILAVVDVQGSHVAGWDVTTRLMAGLSVVLALRFWAIEVSRWGREDS